MADGKGNVPAAPESGDGTKKPVPVKLDRRSVVALFVVCALLVFGIGSTIADLVHPERKQVPGLGDAYREFGETFMEEFPFFGDSLEGAPADTVKAGAAVPAGAEVCEGEKTETN